MHATGALLKFGTPAISGNWKG